MGISRLVIFRYNLLMEMRGMRMAKNVSILKVLEGTSLMGFRGEETIE
jgi:hypothetical protein